jgi:CBS domain-containing protein
MEAVGGDMTRAADLMWKDIPAVLPPTTVRRVAEIMRQHAVEAVPIVQDEGGRRPIGVIWAVDIVTGCIAAGHDPSACQVREHMSTDFILRRPEDDVTPVLASATGQKGRATAVVVMDGAGRLVGMLPQPPREPEAVPAEKVEPMVGGMGGMELVWRCLDCGYQLLGAPVPPASCPDCGTPKENFMLVTED